MQEVNRVNKLIKLGNNLTLKRINRETWWVDFVKGCKKYPIGGTNELKNIVTAFNAKHTEDARLTIFPVHTTNIKNNFPMLDDIKNELGKDVPLVDSFSMLDFFNPECRPAYNYLPAHVVDGSNRFYIALQLWLQPLPVIVSQRDNHREKALSMTQIALILAAKEKGQGCVSYYLFADNLHSQMNWNNIKKDVGRP